MPEFVMEVAECQPVLLKPFIHQVGGHTSMLRFDETTVCKPLISREHHFYQCLPPELKEFTPQYKGVADVAYQEDSSGCVNLLAYPIDLKSGHRKTVQASSSPSSGGDTAQSDSDGEHPSSSSSRSQTRNGRSRQRYRVKRSGSVEDRVETYEPYEERELLDNGLLQVHGHNPWQLKCQKRTLDKMRKNGQGKKSTTKFIILENLIWHFEIPCVLDLKMGTRQHGDDATEEKRLLHSAKCETTTSGKLGSRLCGMQVFQADTGQYICRDKYFGRAIGEQGFQECLHQFLHNGIGLRTDVLDCVVERLRGLKAMLSKQNTFRFYSSSLLVMYDGSLGSGMDGSLGPGMDGSLGPGMDSSSDRGMDNSLDPEMDPLTAPLQDQPSPSTSQPSYSQEIDHELSNDSTESQEDPESHEEVSWGEEEEEEGCAQSPCKLAKTSSASIATQLRVDVRMIDFAHVTHQGFHGDRIVHQGPDHGYILGLQNLIDIFESIKQQYISSQA